MKRRTPRFLFAFSLSLALFPVTFSVATEPLPQISLPQKGICAHRGENGVFPENTVVGFQEAVRLGAAMVEFDVRRSKEGRLIIMHDQTVDRTTDGRGKTTDLTFEEIRSLDAGIKKGERFAGTRVPTLVEALDCLPRDIWINVHVCTDKAEEIAKIIFEKKRQHQAFLACDHRQAEAVKKAYPQILICNMERQFGDHARYIRETIEWKCDFIQLVAPPTEEQAKALKDAGIRINYFPAKNPEHFKQLIERGVDFPLVDHCSRFLDVAGETGVLKPSGPTLGE